MNAPVARLTVAATKQGRPTSSPTFLDRFAFGLAWTPLSTLSWHRVAPGVFEGRWKSGPHGIDPVPEVWLDVCAAGEIPLVHDGIDLEFVATIEANGRRVVTRDAPFFYQQRRAYRRRHQA